MQEPSLPDGTTKLVKDWYYGIREFPDHTSFHQECNGSGCRDCIRGLEMDGTMADIYNGTHVRCGHCKTIRMTPMTSRVESGILNCQNCGKVSIIDSDIAEECNQSKNVKVS